MNYAVFGTNNILTATAFYDALFEGLKINKVAPSERMVYWISEGFAFAISEPFNKEAATNGKGTMIGFAVESPDEVKRLHKKSIEMGGMCEGGPGKRGPKFAAYVRDLDKNKICFSS